MHSLQQLKYTNSDTLLFFFETRQGDVLQGEYAVSKIYYKPRKDVDEPLPTGLFFTMTFFRLLLLFT